MNKLVNAIDQPRSAFKLITSLCIVYRVTKDKVRDNRIRWDKSTHRTCCVMGVADNLRGPAIVWNLRQKKKS